jgi:membrane-associated phospholipid phosphatase
MMLMRIIRLNPFFWGILFIFLAASGIYLCNASAKEIFFQLNSIHTLYLDTFFQNCTLLGDGVFSIAVFLFLLLAEQFNLALQVATGYVFSGMAAQLLKRFSHAPRPHAIISNTEYHYFLEGITHSGMTSFPSGHTTSVFALATLLALNSGNKKMASLYVIPAILTGYSRIYLGEHFLHDVVAGTLLGVLSAMLIHWWLRKVQIVWVPANQYAMGNKQ